MKKIFPLILMLSFCMAQNSMNFEELLDRYPELSTYGSTRASSNIEDSRSAAFIFSDYTEEELLTLDSLGVLEILMDTTETAIAGGLIHFGYSFFKSPDKVLIFDNIPIPKDYILGPGDQISISLWGATEYRSKHMISREGDIFIEDIGNVNLAGYDIQSAETILVDKFSKTVSTLKGRNPSTHLGLSIGQLKSINISFVGEVFKPGIHAVHPFSDITTALLQVGGIDTVGTLRNIEIIRNGKIHTKFDFYDFLVAGKTRENVKLINGDVIYVPVRQSYLAIEGEVSRPGIYEAKEGDSIKEIISYAGGLKPTAQSSLELYRLLNRNSRNSEDNAYNISHVAYNDTDDQLAFGLTKIRALPVPNVTREVSILGQVKLPGIYAFDNSMYLIDLFNIAGGLADSTFLQSIYIKEAEIIRQRSDSIYPKRIAIDIDKLIARDPKHNIKLNNNDIVLVRENSNYNIPKYVTVGGQVKVPGKYTIQQKEETLDAIIKRAGGYTNNAFENGLKLYRDSTQVVLSGYDIFVADKDSVFVPESPGVIKVEGQVHRQGLIQFQKGKSIRYYIEKAGGYTFRANKKNVIVQYANGNVRAKKTFLFSSLSVSPPIHDGSTITVFREQPKPPFNFTQFLATTAQVATSITTLYLLYLQTQ